eukprot:CAMPEP_0195283612 /NCGR_PEP_ID=MMETSP0707-20130614/2092_1 /TAXON_ID=33640 /ORGANISM="Asterionellopsis glacialis, Strain CCMP134" /LENGTH=787 /DNA_ID=CAMNT_0040342801 /DNA_START=53 /DNA_END=2416 /DNA_ORIENTATION=-
MSLATAGGGFSAGAGAGGMVSMAHQANANAMARGAQAQPPPGSDAFEGAGSTAPPPTSAAALGADLLDKSQSLNLKQVRNVSHLPLVAVDLEDGQIGMFPPKPKNAAGGPLPFVSSAVGTIRPITLQSTETAHKTLRKYLAKDKGYDSIKADALSKDGIGVTVPSPKQWLGVRRLKDVDSHVRDQFPTASEEESTAAIAEEKNSKKVGVTLVNGTLDGLSAPTGDDFDRVVYKVKLVESKKTLTVLPEEALAMQLAQAQHTVSRKVKPDDVEVDDYPLAVSVPAYACHDAGFEALLDATSGTGVIFQRSIAACTACLLPGQDPNPILERINQIKTKKHKEHIKENPESTGYEYNPLLLLVGLTSTGIECTAVQLSELQPDCKTCLFGNFKVLTNVSYPSKDPESMVSKCIDEIQENLEIVAPEADGPVGMVAYGTKQAQSAIQEQLKTADLDNWNKVPVFTTKPDCVAVGTAILGGITHGRISTLTEGKNKKPKAQLAIRVQNVAPTAVGIRMNYHGGDPDKWTPAKVLFDFDRRVPAGPYPMDFTAAECAAHRAAGDKPLTEETIVEATKNFEGSKAIPQREIAALNFQVQIVQKYTRTGPWKKVSGYHRPLTKHNDDAPEDSEESRVGCESATLELSFDGRGVITSTLIGDGQTVVQALKSARNSKLRYYLGMLFLVVFVGGFFVKSYVDEKIFDRDTERLMAYYKNVIPGSIQDGDIYNARYLVYKYRNKKAKLWKNLETKYGEPVLETWEWPEPEETESEEEEVENLDDEQEAGGDDKQEPDL